MSSERAMVHGGRELRQRGRPRGMAAGRWLVLAIWLLSGPIADTAWSGAKGDAPAQPDGKAPEHRAKPDKARPVGCSQSCGRAVGPRRMQSA